MRALALLRRKRARESESLNSSLKGKKVSKQPDAAHSLSLFSSRREKASTRLSSSRSREAFSAISIRTIFFFLANS